MDVELRIETLGPGGTTLLANGWFYVLQGGAVTVGRTDALGRVRALRAGGNASHAWEYTERFVLTVGAQVDVYHSAGKTPIPGGVLSGAPTAFEQLVVPPASAQAVQVSPSGTNTLAVTPTARLQLTQHVLQFSTAELDLLPVTFTSFRNDYLTNSLAQGATAFPPAGLTVTEDAVAPVPAASVRPRERAPLLRGLVDAAATAVRVRVLNAAGAALQLLASPTATAGVQEVAATLAAPSGASRAFQLNLLFQDPPGSFGPVQVVVVADGLAKPVLETAFFVLTGFEVALVDDTETNASGAQAGPIRGEADDRIVVDFLVSPQSGNAAVITPAEQTALAAAQVGKTAAVQQQLAAAAQQVANNRAKALNRADLSAQCRVRRMVQYRIGTRSRALAPAQPVLVTKPEMPMWMGELHLAGLTRTVCQDLLQHRKHSAPPAPAGTGAPPPPPLFRLSFNWEITMRWDAPNSAATTRPFRYTETFQAPVQLSLDLDASDQLQSVTGDVATAAFNPAPVALSVPVNTRRAPQVRFGAARPWGRVSGAASVPTTIVEFQPSISVAGTEVMRGGDADLKVRNVTLDGTAFSAGSDPQGASFVAPASTDITAPTARVIGVTPANAEIEALLDELVSEFFTANAAAARIQLLSLARWQTTVRLIVAHESGTNPGMQHFETRGAGRRTFGLTAFGHEQHMPLFGAPAGFGLGQLDNPPVTTNEMWSYLEGLRASVRLIMGAKATAAFGVVQPHLTVVPNATAQAVYQRELVRRYNGNREFRFQGGQFEIFPTGTDPARLSYPNAVLGTNVVYQGLNTAVAFTAANFGP